MTNRKAISIIIGIALGYSVAVGFLPCGFDALHFYLRGWFAQAPAQVWVYAVTWPISLIGWPLGLCVLTLISVMVSGLAALAWGNRNGWIVLLSPALMWCVWLGQIEVFTCAGVLLIALAQHRSQRVSPLLIGLGLVALMTKPMIGIGAAIVSLYWTWKDFGARSVVIALATSALILGMTLVVNPSWVADWIKASMELTPTWWNASAFPFGIALGLIGLLQPSASRAQRLRQVLAATLLCSPYFSLYHCTTLLVLVENPIALIVSWALVALGGEWMRFAWVVPVSVLMLDAVRV